MRLFVVSTFLLAIILTSASCQKETPALNLQIHYDGTFPLNDLEFIDDQCYAVGGEVFDSGFLVNFDTGSNQISIDTVQSKSIFSLNIQGDFICAGVYTLASFIDGQWKSVVMDELYIMRETVVIEDKIIAVGGAGLSSGVIYHYDLDLETWEAITRPNTDLYFIRRVGDDIYYGGYGYLGKASIDDPGYIPEAITDFEDHFIDISFSEEAGTIILGASGRLIQKVGNGSFSEIRKPNSSGISDFKDLEVIGDKIYLSGEDKIVSTSVNDFDWSTIPVADMGSITKMKTYENRLYFVTETGKIASISN